MSKATQQILSLTATNKPEGIGYDIKPPRIGEF